METYKNLENLRIMVVDPDNMDIDYHKELNRFKGKLFTQNTINEVLNIFGKDNVLFYNSFPDFADDYNQEKLNTETFIIHFFTE